MSTTTSATEARELAQSTANENETGKVLHPKWLARGIAGAVLLAALTAGTMLWLDSRHYETTDDAQVDGHFAELSTRIEGTVVWVNPKAENDHTLMAGDLLLQLDPRDSEVALERAKANLKVRQSQARAAQLVVPITDASAFNQLRAAEAARQEALAGVETAQADLLGAQHRLERDEAVAGRAERDRVRYKALVEKREISRSDYDARETEALAAAQAVESDRAAIAADERKVAQGGSVVAQREAQIESGRTAPQQLQNARANSDSAQGGIDQALAEVHAAELNLSYTKIYAPVNVWEFQISGGPGWIDSIRYDIEGKVGGEPGQDQMKLMLQTLLGERFKLALRKGTRELPIYKLTVAKDGFKLRPLKEGDCIVFDPNHPPSTPGLTSSDFCGNLTTGRGSFEGTSASMTDLARSFSSLMGRTVMDGTGITGVFHVRLKFDPDDPAAGISRSSTERDNTAPPADNRPSIFTALQEQLGLKLESGKGPVDVLVIDRVEKPTEN